MKNKHYDKIVAKAANMDLVVFFNPSFGSGAGKWEEATTTLFPAFHPDTEYFLCLPQHKEAVLRGLNGEIVESTNENREDWSESSVELWDKGWWYMSDNCVSRTKPKKEQRCIAFLMENIIAVEHDVVDAERRVVSKGFDLSKVQFIEIEVEV